MRTQDLPRGMKRCGAMRAHRSTRPGRIAPEDVAEVRLVRVAIDIESHDSPRCAIDPVVADDHLVSEAHVPDTGTVRSFDLDGIRFECVVAFGVERHDRTVSRVKRYGPYELIQLVEIEHAERVRRCRWRHRGIGRRHGSPNARAIVVVSRPRAARVLDFPDGCQSIAPYQGTIDKWPLAAELR